MKKIMVILLIMCLFNTCSASAKPIEAVYNENGCLLERVEVWHEPFPLLEVESYIFDMNGKAYFFSEKTTTIPRPYVKEEYEFFAKELGIRDYFWTGEYYYGRHVCTDDAFESYKGGNHKIYLYNKDFNLVKSSTFDQYPKEIVYTDGIYYVGLAEDSRYGKRGAEKIMCSQDFDEWRETDNIIYKKNDVYYAGNSISFDNKKHYNVLFENENMKLRRQANLGFSKIDFPLWQIINKKYLTKNNIYFLELDMTNVPEKLSVQNAVRGTYFYENSFVLYYGEGRNVMLNKDEIINQLNDIENAPYVTYDNSILAFEQPPVIENGRTLIPIRFLFEQMGATVDWDGDTQTATISQANTAVSFAINDTDANVNGQTVSMDVPAQLINGKTMVPVRFLSENLGYTVDWDGENRIITIE